MPVVFAALAAALGAFVLRRTRLGRYAFAIGGNAEAARLSGVPVAKVTMAIYVAIGVLTGARRRRRRRAHQRRHARQRWA